MSEIFDSFNNITDFILSNRNDLIKNPLTWIVLGIILAGIYALFDVSEKTRQNGFGNVMRQLLQIILDVTSDLLDLLRSLAGFLQVLQTLLFGKLGKRTLHILTNYAIVYLSAASFITTFSGLQKVLDLPIAMFVSFGIQVSILICSVELQKNFMGEDSNNASKTVYKYLFEDNALQSYSFSEKTYLYSIEEEIETEKEKNNNKNAQATPNTKVSIDIQKNTVITGIKDSKDSAGTNDSTVTTGPSKFSKFLRFLNIKNKKIGRMIILGLLIMVSVLFSSFFSYLFMFEKFVEGNLVYDDHFRTMMVTHEIIEEYSRELNRYRADVVEILEQYNDVVEERLNLQEDNPLRQKEEFDNTINDLKEQKSICTAEIEEVEQAITAMEAGTEEYLEALNELREWEDEIVKLDNDIATKETRFSEDNILQSRLQAYNSILKLSNFYANAAGIQNSSGGGQEGEIIQDVSAKMTEESLRLAFVELQQAEAGLQNSAEYGAGSANRLTEADRIELVNAFESYMSLGRYFSAHESLQVNFQDIEKEINGITYNDEYGNEDYVDKSNVILQTMLSEMNRVPVLGSVRNVWSGRLVSPPGKTEYLERIYGLYRDNNGTVTSFERAINKLFGRNGEKKLLALEMAVMALVVDGTIIWLTFLRGRKNYKTDIAELRRLLGILFVDDSIDRETVKMRKEQSFCITMGFSAGILCYVLFQMSEIQQNVKPMERGIHFLFCVIMGVVLGLIAYQLYHMVQGRKKKWENEALYIKWKKIWLDGVRDEKELDRRIDSLRWGRIPEGFQLSKEDIFQVEELWRDEHEQQLLHKYFYTSVNDLFQKMQEKRCVKCIVVWDGQNKIPTNLKCFSEKMILPCLSEEDVDRAGLKPEFCILQSKHIIGFDFLAGEGFYILTERFWNLLYDTILFRLVGGRIGKYDITEELENESEDYEE